MVLVDGKRIMDILIKNELLEALAKSDLSGGEFRVLLAVILRGCGSAQEPVYCTYGILSELTGMSGKHCQRLTRELVARKILVKTKRSSEQWLMLDCKMLPFSINPAPVS